MRRSCCTTKLTHRALRNSIRASHAKKWMGRRDDRASRNECRIRGSLREGSEGTEESLDTDRKPPRALKLLSAFIRTGGSPALSYVPRPRGPLHMVNARIKMLWLAFLLALLPRAEILPRAGVAAVLVSFAASSRASRRAIPRMVLLALFGGVLTLLAGQARPPPLFPRAPTPVEVDLIAKSSIWHASVDPSGTFGEPLFGILPSIPKVLHISKSVWLRAVSVFLATYTTTQSASLLLVTTPPDALARVTAGICILVSRKAAKEMEITLLLAIRFLAVIAAELHSLALGVAAKGIAWRSLGTADGIAICIAVIQRITRNMQLHVKATARAMEARGFTNPWQHQLLQTDDEWGFADGVAIALLIMLASAIFLT